jgi:hypothetical protein
MHPADKFSGNDLCNEQLDFIRKLNGMCVHRSMRELYEIDPDFKLPDFAGSEVIILRFPYLAEADFVYGIFFKNVPDSFYFFEPNKDTQSQLAEATNAS